MAAEWGCPAHGDNCKKFGLAWDCTVDENELAAESPDPPTWELFHDFEAGANRLERSRAANMILEQIGVDEPTVDDVARLMRWADTYAHKALEHLHETGWKKAAGA